MSGAWGGIRARRTWVRVGIGALVLSVAAMAAVRWFHSPYDRYEEYRRRREERAGQTLLRLEPRPAAAGDDASARAMESDLFRRKREILAGELRGLDRALLDHDTGTAERLATTILEKLLTDDDCLAAACLMREMPEEAVIDGFLAVILFRPEAAEPAALLKERLVAAAMYSQDQGVRRRALQLLRLDSSLVGEEDSRSAFRWGDLRDAGLTRSVLQTILEGDEDSLAVELVQLLGDVPPELREEVQRDVLVPAIERFARLDEEQPKFVEYGQGMRYRQDRLPKITWLVERQNSNYDVEQVYAGLTNPRARRKLWPGLPTTEPYLSDWKAEAQKLLSEGPNRMLGDPWGGDGPSLAAKELARADQYGMLADIVRPYHALLADEPFITDLSTGEERVAWSARWDPIWTLASGAFGEPKRDQAVVAAFIQEMRSCGHTFCRNRIQALDRIPALPAAEGENP